jgi:1-pyrroline-5-carboxylate dehydrogenase
MLQLQSGVEDWQATDPPSPEEPGRRWGTRMYIPLGVGAVIPPWNFPFAIMAGMTAAAIVTGNTVVLKPSSDAPTIAAQSSWKCWKRRACRKAW